MRVGLIEGFRDVGRPVGVWASEAKQRVLLISIYDLLQLDAVVADIGDVEQRVLRQTALDAEEVALNVTVSSVLGDVGDVVSRGVEAGHEAAGKALIGGSIAGRSRRSGCDDLRGQRCGTVIGCGRRDLGDRGKLRLRSVDSQDVSRSCARVVGVAYTKTTANCSLRVDRIGETDTRAEVGVIGINQRLAVGPAGRDRRNAVASNGSGSC